MSASAEIIVETTGRLGLLTLNRPAALNALNLDMIRALNAAFEAFEADGSIDAIAITSAGDKAFCAGGDVRSLVAGPPDEADRLRRTFFAEEYRLNHRINICPKPVIAFMDGVTMGGGCGLSLHAVFPVATERTMLAMPETLLGFMPDVGATWFLAKLAAPVSIYVGMTGVRLRAADLMRLGLTRNFVAAADIAGTVAALGAAPHLDRAAIDGILQHHAGDAGNGFDVTTRLAEIETVFSATDVPALKHALAGIDAPWASQAAGVLARAAPLALMVVHRQLGTCRGLDIAEALRLEYRLSVRLTARRDFAEGVRSVLIDKTVPPDWDPATLEDVDPAMVEALFQPMAAAEELTLINSS